MPASCMGCRQLSSLPPGDSRIPGQYSFAGGTDSSMCLCLWVTIQSPLPGPVGLLMVFLTAGPVVRAGGSAVKPALWYVWQCHVVLRSSAGLVSQGGDAQGRPRGSPQGPCRAEPGGAGVASTPARYPPPQVGVTCPLIARQAVTNLCKTTTYNFHFIFPWLMSVVTPQSECPQSLWGRRGCVWLLGGVRCMKRGCCCFWPHLRLP